jgi:hypothetical protein
MDDHSDAFFLEVISDRYGEDIGRRPGRRKERYGDRRPRYRHRKGNRFLKTLKFNP